jgi:hypothetical protein
MLPGRLREALSLYALLAKLALSLRRDAQPGVRGKSPLQLAGYDVSKLPMTTLCAGLSILWPLAAEVPKS